MNWIFLQCVSLKYLTSNFKCIFVLIFCFTSQDFNSSEKSHLEILTNANIKLLDLENSGIGQKFFVNLQFSRKNNEILVYMISVLSLNNSAFPVKEHHIIRLNLSKDSRYGLNVCILPKFMCWIAVPQCEGIWKCGLWEVIRFQLDHKGGDSILGLVSLEEEDGRPELALFLLCEDTEDSYLQAPVRGLSQELNQPVLHLGLLRLYSMRNKCCCFRRPEYGILL